MPFPSQSVGKPCALLSAGHGCCTAALGADCHKALQKLFMML